MKRLPMLAQRELALFVNFFSPPLKGSMFHGTLFRAYRILETMLFMQIEDSASPFPSSSPVQSFSRPRCLVNYGISLFPLDLVKEILSYLTPTETIRSTTLVGRCLNPTALNLFDKGYWKNKCMAFFPQSVGCIRNSETVNWQTFYRDSTLLHQHLIAGHVSQVTKLDHPDYHVKWVRQAHDLVLIALESIISLWNFGAPKKNC